MGLETALTFFKNAVAAAALEAGIIGAISLEIASGQRAEMRVPILLGAISGGMAGSALNTPVITRVGIVIGTAVVAAVGAAATGAEEALMTGIKAGVVVGSAVVMTAAMDDYFQVNKAAIYSGMGVGIPIAAAAMIMKVSAPIFAAIAIGITGMTAGSLAIYQRSQRLRDVG